MSSKCHSSISAVGCILSLQENGRKIWGAVVRGVSSQKAPQQDSGTVTSITPCPRTGLLEQVTPAGWEDAHRDRVRHCGLYGLLYGLKCWKIKQLLHLFAFLLSCMLCFPYIPYIYIYTLYHIFPYMHIFSLQFTVQFLLYAADIQMLTGLFGAGSLVQGFSLGIIKADFKHVQCDCHTNTVLLLFWATCARASTALTGKNPFQIPNLNFPSSSLNSLLLLLSLQFLMKEALRRDVLSLKSSMFPLNQRESEAFWRWCCHCRLPLQRVQGPDDPRGPGEPDADRAPDRGAGVHRHRQPPAHRLLEPPR